MARSKFRTHYGRRRKKPFRYRRAVRHHGFLTRYHRPVTGGKTPRKRRRGPARQHVTVVRSAHPGKHVIGNKTRAKAAKHAGRTKAHRTHPKAAAHHTAGHRHESAATKAKLSKALTGKHHPHRGHHLSNAARAKIKAAARHKGRPHPHRGHHLSNQARLKMSRAMKGKHHARHKGTRRKRR